VRDRGIKEGTWKDCLKYKRNEVEVCFESILITNWAKEMFENVHW